ncbi:MAG TPA: leucyl aminopeptidase family protein [Steroidobacteraceae bacterium]|nr:leucyl aminopeptidase family protein [Steroidobacteraceae bacterium]
MRPLNSHLTRRSASWPALPQAPAVVRRARLSERAAAALDAILVLVPHDAGDGSLAHLPQAERWLRLRARAQQPNAVRSATLANARDTRAVLGVLPPRASPFETLALAGRMLKEIAGDAEVIALAAPLESNAARAARGAGEAAAAAPAADERLSALLSAALAHAFELPSFRGPAHSTPAPTRRHLQRIEIVEGGPLDLSYIEAAARGNDLARFLTALPPNVLDARAYRDFLARFAREHGLAFEWLGESALERLGANAFLAVARGNSERTAGIAHLTYRPAATRRGRSRDRAPSHRAARRAGAPDVALVGKGILFDTGGTNLKPHRSMLDMHTDMAGSAVALATLGALARLHAPLAADAWLAITENRIGPQAYVPQEVVRAANGVTIQVIHTDAEGRMALADTLALAGRTRPRLMIDFATLTGTCVYALTERMSGLTTNEPRLLPTLLAAGRSSGERVWSFPFEADYDADLESKVADVLQCSVEAKGDHILAARFLARFVPEGTPWVHLDLSSALRAGGLAHVPTDVTGFGVRYALELLLRTRVLEEARALA